MKYDKKIVDRICEMISTDSYTIPEICKGVGIAESTFHEWKSKKPEFSKAVKKAKDKFDEFILSEAQKSLVKLIQGYTVKEERTVTLGTGKIDESGKPIVKVKERIVTDKHYQPVTAAVIFALTNRDPEHWKNRQQTDVTTNGKDIISQVTVIEIPDNGRDRK